MKGSDGAEVRVNCQTCTLRGNGFFCQLPVRALNDLDALKVVSAYGPDTILFMEEQTSQGVYVLCDGEVKLSVSSSEGKTLNLRIAKPGDVLGLSATLSGTPHEVTAETLGPCQVAFVLRDAFLQFLTQHPEAYPAVVRRLAAHYQVACEQLRTVVLCTSAPERLAKMLLEFSTTGQETKQGTRVDFPLTHEEIGAFIGATRETVTRTLSDFKNKKLARIEGSTLLIHDRPALRSLVAASRVPLRLRSQTSSGLDRSLIGPKVQLMES